MILSIVRFLFVLFFRYTTHFLLLIFPAVTPIGYIHVIHQMGYCWRDEWKVMLCHGDHEPEISEVYAEYCDLLAQGKNVSFNKETGEIVNDDDPV